MFYSTCFMFKCFTFQGQLEYALWPMCCAFCVQTIIFCLVVCAMLFITGLLVRSATNQSNEGTGSSSLTLTTWIDGPPPAYYEGGQPVWTDEQLLTQADAFDFVLYGTQTTGLFDVRLGLRLVYTDAANNAVQDALFDYTFQVRSQN